MAINRIMSVRDGKAGIYLKPQFYLHLGQAMRDWDSLVNEPGSVFAKFPEDFTLFEMGTFDDENGQIQVHTVPMQLSSAREVQKITPSQATLRAAN